MIPGINSNFKKSCARSKLKGLDLFADDYLTKPFILNHWPELKVWCAKAASEEQEAYQVSNLVLNRLKHEVYRNRHKDRLDQTNLRCSMIRERQGQVMTRSQILNRLEFNFNTDTKMWSMFGYCRLSSKIHHHYTPKIIHTVRSMGSKAK